MSRLKYERTKQCKNFALRYLLYEETPSDCLCDGKCSFYRIAIELNCSGTRESADTGKLAGTEKGAHGLLDAFYRGMVTPISLPYVVEDCFGIFEERPLFARAGKG